MFFVRTKFTVMRAKFAETGGTNGVVVGGLVSFYVKAVIFVFLNFKLLLKRSTLNKLMKVPALKVFASCTGFS